MLTQAHVRALFDYDPSSGKLTRRVRASANAPAGSEPGWIGANGYRAVSVDNKKYYAHRIIWLWMTGDMPDAIDHIDGVPLNNAWTNLRPATVSENMRNKRKSRSGLKGVERVTGYDNKFSARIKFEGKRHYLGIFGTEREAHEAYKAAAVKYFGEFARFE